MTNGDTHAKLAEEMRDQSRRYNSAHPDRVWKWADRVEALGRQTPSTSQEVQTEQWADETLPLGGEQAEGADDSTTRLSTGEPAAPLDMSGGEHGEK